jgi:GNAT superfamily N-acetyltransferase
MLEVRPVTSDRWQELAAFFGPSGAFSHCWCTWWRQTGGEFTRGIEAKGEGNQALMHSLVEAGSEPGLLAYQDGRPVGWVSVAPRVQYGRVLRSRRIGPVPEEATDEQVWSVVCFWIPRAERGKGVATALLAGAVDHARARGAAP